MVSDALEFFSNGCEKKKPGPRPKFGRAMTPAERMARVRSSRKTAGMQQIWISKKTVEIVKRLRIIRDNRETVDAELVNELLREVIEFDVK